MKYNLIYFDANQLEDYFFNEDYRKAYDIFLDNTFQFLFTIFTGRIKNDLLVCIEPDRSGHMTIVNVPKEKVNKIWVRGKNFDYEKYKDFNVINTQIVENIADDKNQTYKYLKDFMPKSQLVYKVADDIYSDDFLEDMEFPAVLKPLKGLKGEGIKKFKTSEGFENYLLSFEVSEESSYILQEFIECVDYKPLGIKGTHDIRLIIVNSEIVGLAIRQPEEGGWLCNVAQGGSIKVYDLEDLQKRLNIKYLLDLDKFKSKVLNLLPKEFKSAIFSIDFCNTSDGFKIFELNSYPGIRLEYQTYINKVKELLNK